MQELILTGGAPDRLLAVDEDGARLTLADLDAFSHRFYGAVGGRTLIFLLCENSPGCLLAYLACLRAGVVPLLLDAGMDRELLDALTRTYRPAFLWGPEHSLPKEGARLWEDRGCALLAPGGGHGPELHPDLSLLLTTSGSTGSPKLVRLSGKNLLSNARSIAQYLTLDETERPVTNLPMSYSYGMSIINSHLLVGAAPRLTRRTVLEREFWDLMEREKITSLAGVPYTYQMFRRLGVMERPLPALKTLTQAGGKLPLDLHRAFARWAGETGRRFFVMYGQTEAAPRMGYLPAQCALEKAGSMGLPIPGGRFRLESDEGSEIDGPGQVGELIYQGPNVAMGYAQTAADLALGDQWHGVLRTGDLARRDRDGFYYIEGRKKRFVKLFGNRVSLDQAEELLAARFPETGFACVGQDDLLSVFTDSRDLALPGAAVAFLAQRTHLPPKAFQVRAIKEIPKSEGGKTLYAKLSPWRE